MTQTNDIEVIIVGNELLKGERVDSHLSYLGRAVLPLGARIARAHVTADSVDEIARVLSGRIGETRTVLVTGGLGPTPDDVTRRGVAAGLGLELEFHEASWNAIQDFFASRGRQATQANRQQAEFPAGSRVLANGEGTAPGFEIESGGTTVFVLPGPPEELRRMFSSHVAPALSERFDRDPLRVDTFRTIGVGESTLFDLVGETLGALSAYDVSSLPSRGGVDILLTEKSSLSDRSLLDTESDAVAEALAGAIGTKFYERGERSLAEVVGSMLAEREETIAIAESLTGGWIGKLLTDVPGASAYVLSDVVAYSNAAKTDLLGVSAETLEKFGAVSEETCTEMAHGARNRAHAAFGLATTGVAGPTGGPPKKPVGLTFLGVSWDGGCNIKRQLFTGTRDDIRRRACQGVLWMLLDHLRKQ
jgi:nicotinamide-nucleotide amidase